MAKKEPGKQADEIDNKKKAAEEEQPGDEGLAEAGAVPDQEVQQDDELTQLEELLATKEQELGEQKEAVLRAHAEVQNMRRRCEQDVERAHKYALEKFGAELLNVADNLERALEAVPETDGEGMKALVEGVELTLKGLLETFTKFAIEQINPEGEPFDPQVHEAMSMVPNPEQEPNTVMAVVQKGYTLNGRVLRPARVLVVKGE